MSCSWWRRWLKRNALRFPLANRPRQRRTAGPRLCLEALEDRTLLAAINPFYDLTTLASTGGSNPFTSFGNLVSVNSAGDAAFVGSTSQGNGLYVVKAGRNTPVNINPQFSNDPNRTFGRGAAINNDGLVSAVDLYSANGYYGYTLRRWDSNALNSSVILSQASSNPDIVPQGKDKDYQALVTSLTDINDSGEVVFDSIGGLAVKPATTIDIGGLPLTFGGGFASSSPPYLDLQYAPGNDVTAGAYTTIVQNLKSGLDPKTGQANPAPRAQLADSGQAIYYSTIDQAIELVSPSGRPQVIASASKGGFSDLGPAAGVSFDGKVVVFTGDRGNGPGIFAVYLTGGKWSQPVRLAGEDRDSHDGFESFDKASAVQIAGSLGDGERGMTVAFVGANRTQGYGLYTSRLSFFGKSAANYDPDNVQSVLVNGVVQVAADGQILKDGATIGNITLWHGLAAQNRGTLTFWVQTDRGQEILRADPWQVVWVDFNPSLPNLTGLSNNNIQLLGKAGILSGLGPGFTGSTKDLVKNLSFVPDYQGLEADVINEVQDQFYQSGARIHVYGRPTDQQPSDIPEAGTDASGLFVLHHAYRTIYVGGTPAAFKVYGKAAAIDAFNQAEDDIAIVSVNVLLTYSLDTGSNAPSKYTQLENGLADTIAHEAGHTFGLVHIDPSLSSELMHGGTNAKEFNAEELFDVAAHPTDFNPNITQSSAARLQFAAGSNGAPITGQNVLPDPALLKLSPNTNKAAIAFPAANTLVVADLMVGVASGGSGNDIMPSFQDLGGGDLATLLNNASISLGPDDSVMVLGSTNGTSLDVVAVASGQEGAQDSFSPTLLGIIGDDQLRAPVSGSGAALHFYQLTANGSVDLGTAAIQLSVPNNPPGLASISNQAVSAGTAVTFTASATDPDTGQTLTFSLDPGAPIGASIDPASGLFSWTPTAAQAGQVYSIIIRVTDNGTPPASDTQSFVINVLNRLNAVAVTALTTPTPGPMQIAVDFSEALQPASAQTVSSYKIVSQDGMSLPIASAVYSNNGTQHRVVLTVASGITVAPDVYHVSVDAGDLTANNGDQGAPKADQLWVDATATNAVEPISVQPDGSFAPGAGQSLGYPPPVQVLAENFTGGPYPDLIVLTNSEINEPGLDEHILLLSSTGNGTYAAPVPISVQGASPIQHVSSSSTAVNQDIGSIAAVDWNHDGHTDLVVSTRSSDLSSISYYILLNDGHGHFTDAPETPIKVSESAPADPFAVYDLEGNGQYEIIHPGPNYNLEVIAKDPYLGYTPQMELPTGLNINQGYVTPAQIEFADLNGDGKPDIITRNGGYYIDNPGVTVLLSTPTGYAAGNDIINPLGAPSAVGVGAFTAAGQQDVAVVYDDYRNSEDTQVGDVIQVLRNDGKGNFTAQDPIVLNRRDIAAAVFGDVNGDGIPDLVMLLTPGTGQYGSNSNVFDHVSQLSVWTWVSDGHGGFTPTTQAPIALATTDESGPNSLVLTDMDADGHPDVLLSGNYQGGGEIRLAINDGTGTMRPAIAPLPYVGSYTGSNFVQRQVFADFNNDGRMDFATTSPAGVDVYLAQADTTFRHTFFATITYAAASNIIWTAVGDLNNDGIPDLIVGGNDNPLSTVYLGNGDGTFRQAATFSTGSAYIEGITLADVNHDGNLDAIATLENGTYGPGIPFNVAVLFGDGKGNLSFNANTVVPALFSSLVKYSYYKPVIGDFNNDGNPDLIIATNNSSTGTTELIDYLGAGNGTFNPGPIIDNNDYVKGLVGDVNGDGKPDLVILHSDFTATAYLGNGQGGFTKTGTLNLTKGYDTGGFPIGPDDIALGDFNGDGKLDLAVSYSISDPRNAQAEPLVEVYEGDGTGNFGTPQSITLAGPASLASIPRTPFLDAGTFAVTDHGPVANNDTATAFAGSSVSVPVLANDTDQDKVPLTTTQVTSPAHGVAHVDPTNNNIIYAPAAGFNGTDAFTYTIADPAGVTSTATVTVSVVAIAITPTSLAAGQVGTSYSQQLSASGGTAPYTFSVSAGQLPAGLTLSSGGLIAGTPTAFGSFTFTIQATDSKGASGSAPYTLAVTPIVSFTPANLPPATVNQAYTQALTGSGGTAPYVRFTVTSGALPAGLTLSATGTISGTPTATGSSTFTIQATDSSPAPGPYTTTQTFTLTVNQPVILPPEFVYNQTTDTLVITLIPSLPNFQFSQTTTASGGTTSSVYTFTLSGSSAATVSQSFASALLTTAPASGASVSVIGQGLAGMAILISNDTYVDESGQKQETPERISLGSLTDAGVGTMSKFAGNNPGGAEYSFLSLKNFPLSYAYAGRNDGTIQLQGTQGTGKVGFVTAGYYSYIAAAVTGLYAHFGEGTPDVVGTSAGNADDFAYHYTNSSASAVSSVPSVFSVSGITSSYMSGSQTNPEDSGAIDTFNNVANGFALNTAVSYSGNNVAYINDSALSDTYVGQATDPLGLVSLGGVAGFSYMYEGAYPAFGEFDVAYGFGTYYASASHGGHDIAYPGAPGNDVFGGDWIRAFS